MKYLLPVVFLLVSSCHSLPEDPTEDFRNLITSQTQDFSQEENWYQGFQPDFPTYERYIKHFRFFENFEEHKIPKHFLGRFQWKEENYASLNIFIPENPKATIAFYHGFLGSARLWVHALRYYMEQDFALVLIDLPGHGFSSGERGGIEDFKDYGVLVERTSSWIKNQKELPDPFFLFGHSTGASGIIQYLFEEPENIAGVILINPLIQTVHWSLAQVGSLLLVPFSSYQSPLFTPDSLVGPQYFPVSWFRKLSRWSSSLSKRSDQHPPMVIHQGLKDEVVDYQYNLNTIGRIFPQARIIKHPDLGHTDLLNEKKAKMIFSDLNFYFSTWLEGYNQGN